MIINKLPELLTAILSTGLSASEAWLDAQTPLPYATAVKASGMPETFADDAPYEGSVEYYVYVWSKRGAEEIEPAARKIEAALSKLDWICTFDSDGFNGDAHQKSLRFRKEIAYDEELEIEDPLEDGDDLETEPEEPASPSPPST